MITAVRSDDTYLGIRVVGDRHAIKRSVEHYGIEQIIIAIPSAGSRKLRPILEICKDTGCELKILPGDVSAGELERSMSVNFVR